MSEEKCIRCNKFFNLTNLHTIFNKDNERSYICDDCQKELEIDACTRLTIEYKKVKIIYQDLEGEFKEIDFECSDWKGFENQKVKYV